MATRRSVLITGCVTAVFLPVSCLITDRTPLRCSAGGIGHALAKAYFKLGEWRLTSRAERSVLTMDVCEGLHVIATARRRSSMEELIQLGIDAYELDVADPQSIQRLRAELEPVLGGKLDILINNACVFSILIFVAS